MTFSYGIAEDDARSLPGEDGEDIVSMSSTMNNLMDEIHITQNEHSFEGGRVFGIVDENISQSDTSVSTYGPF